ncbi:MAG: hypothetical protein IT381_29325 [Deltaproteobacteria bacterium]|nr:hypothetical protein [Deltaproteobacteria bacterium]
MGGIAVIVSFDKAPKHVPRFHKALWQLIRKRIGKVVKRKVTKRILSYYVDAVAAEGLGQGEWQASDDGVWFSFHDASGSWVFEKYLGYHWTVRALRDGFDEAQALAKKHGAKLKVAKWGAGSYAYFNVGEAIACLGDDNALICKPGKGGQGLDIATLAEAAHARELLAKGLCECELCAVAQKPAAKTKTKKKKKT